MLHAFFCNNPHYLFIHLLFALLNIERLIPSNKTFFSHLDHDQFSFRLQKQTGQPMLKVCLRWLEVSTSHDIKKQRPTGWQVSQAPTDNIQNTPGTSCGTVSTPLLL